MAAALALLLLAGCAGPALERGAESRLASALGQARCEQTLDEAWDSARRLLATLDYPLALEDAEAAGQAPGPAALSGDLARFLSSARATHEERAQRVLETGWRRGRRYRLTGASDRPGCHVTFLAIREDPGQPLHDVWEAPRRDLQLELELLRRLAPDQAARAEALASAAAAP